MNCQPKQIRVWKKASEDLQSALAGCENQKIQPALAPYAKREKLSTRASDEPLIAKSA